MKYNEKHETPYLDILKKYLKGEIDYSSCQDLTLSQNNKDGLLNKYFSNGLLKKIKEDNLYEMSIVKTITDEIQYHAGVKGLHNEGSERFLKLVDACSIVYNSTLLGFEFLDHPKISFSEFIKKLSNTQGKSDYKKVMKIKKEKEFWELVNEIEIYINK